MTPKTQNTFTIGGVRMTVTEGRVLRNTENGFLLALEGNSDDFNTLKDLLKAHLRAAGYSMEVMPRPDDRRQLEAFVVGLHGMPHRGASCEHMLAECANLQRSIPDRDALIAAADRLETAAEAAARLRLAEHEARAAMARREVQPYVGAVSDYLRSQSISLSSDQLNELTGRLADVRLRLDKLGRSR